MSLGIIVAGMNRSVFQQIGRLLWGPRWRSEMARELSVVRATVMRWDAGTVAVPMSAWKKLGKLLRTRRAQIEHYIDKLPPEAK